MCIFTVKDQRKMEGKGMGRDKHHLSIIQMQKKVYFYGKITGINGCWTHLTRLISLVYKKN